MATLEQLSAALVKADAAGNTDDARALAAEIRKMRGVGPVKEVPSFVQSLKDEALTSIPGGVARGIKDVIDTGAEFLSKLASSEEAARVKAMNEAGKAEFAAAQERVGAGASDIGRIGGNILATLPFGGAAGKIVGKVAPKLGQAIASGGMSTGARVAPGFMPAAADLGVRAAGGAIGGGLTAGLVNPDDATLGAVLGGGIPLVAKAGGVAGRAVGNAISQKMASSNAANKLAALLGDDVVQAIGDIQTYYPKGAEGIPVSAAAATKSAKLAQAEQGSRLLSSPQWHEFDVKQAEAAYKNVLRATGEAEELGALAAARKENWKNAWETASLAQKPRVWQRRMTQFGADMETALRSPEASNPNVRQVLDAINSEMDRVGPEFSIGHLQQIRANLNGKVQPMSQDAFKSAPRDNPAIISLKKEMDDILNAVTGGKWQKVIKGYSQDTAELHASKAAQKIRNAYVDAETGRIVSPVIGGETPRVTAANLSSAMNAARLPDKSLALSQGANQRLEATIEALRRQAMVQELKRSATAGGDSGTVSNALAVGAAKASGAPNMLMQLLAGVRQLGTGRTDNAMAQLLANPDELAAALSALQQPVRPNRLASVAARSAPALVAGQ